MMKGIEMMTAVDTKKLVHETPMNRNEAIGDLPWLEEIKEMADKLDEEQQALQSIREQNKLENWRLSDLDDASNEVVLIALAFNHGWGLSYSGKFHSYIAKKKARSSDIIKAWSYYDRTKPFNPWHTSENYHIRFNVYKTRDNIKHRFIVKFSNTNPCETVSSYASGINYWAKQMMLMDVNEMDNMKVPFRDRHQAYDRLTNRCYTTGVFSIIDHQIIPMN